MPQAVGQTGAGETKCRQLIFQTLKLSRAVDNHRNVDIIGHSWRPDSEKQLWNQSSYQTETDLHLTETPDKIGKNWNEMRFNACHR
jgi:hypothetical protein